MMMHVLLTPPGEPTTEENLGIASIPRFCLPVVAPLCQEMVEAGWIVSIVMNPAKDFPEDSPYRVRARAYIEQFGWEGGQV